MHVAVTLYRPADAEDFDRQREVSRTCTSLDDRSLSLNIVYRLEQPPRLYVI